MRAVAVRQTGFTLLEILVVVMLIGLLTAVAIFQGSWTSDDRQLEQATARLRDTVTLLNERSLFSGQLMALRLEHNGWTPLAYDRVEGEFLPVDDTSLKPYSMPASLELVWQIDELDDAEGQEQATLEDVAKVLVEDDVMAGSDDLLENDEQRENDDEEEEKPFPQMFFFPSGEVSPVTLSVRSLEDLDQERRLQVTALGRLTDPDREENEPAEQDLDWYDKEES